MKIDINLIPDYKKEEILQIHRVRTVIKFGIVLLLVAIVLFAYLLGIKRVLDLEYGTASSAWALSSDKSQYDKIKDYEDKFKDINSDTQQVAGIMKDQLYWSKLLLLLSRDVSDGIEITDLMTKNYSVSLVGKSDTRDNLLSFKGKLEKEDCFSAVNLPLSNLVSQENIDFQMDLTVKEDCIKNK